MQQAQNEAQQANQRPHGAQDRADEANQQAQQAEDQAQQAHNLPGHKLMPGRVARPPGSFSGRDAHRLTLAFVEKLRTAALPAPATPVQTSRLRQSPCCRQPRETSGEHGVVVILGNS